ncbi:MAG: hypothetical protein Q4A11_03345 [Brachymonas sp.]|nr:hypothetical protein [Brachymonas sp.]
MKSLIAIVFLVGGFFAIALPFFAGKPPSESEIRFSMHRYLERNPSLYPEKDFSVSSTCVQADERGAYLCMLTLDSGFFSKSKKLNVIFKKINKEWQVSQVLHESA